MTSSSTEKKDIRKFGAIALCLFGLFFAAALWRGKIAPSIFFALLSCLGFFFLVLPGPMTPAYVAWLRVSQVIGRITTGMILVLAYYLALTPTALCKRLFGGKPLPVSPDRGAATYWVPRSEPAQPKERFKKRY
jgi:hypothetical protein